MKAITPIIGIIILLLITIALVGSAYTFLFGIAESATSKTIRVTPVYGSVNSIIIQNIGTSTIQPEDIRITVEGKESFIINSQTIIPKQNVILKFNSPAIKESATVRIIGPTNVQNTKINTQGELYRDLVVLHHGDSDFSDSSGFGNDGNPQNDTFVNITGGCIGGAYQFDGDQDYINISFSPELDVIDTSLNSTTMAVWLKTSSTSGFHVIFSQGSGSGTGRNWLRFNGGIGDIDTVLGSGSTALINNYPQDNQWHHVAFTYNGTDFAGFLDGVQNMTAIKLNIDEDADGAYVIGVNKGVSGGFFNGSIDEIGIWRRILTPAEISQLYQMGADAGCV